MINNWISLDVINKNENLKCFLKCMATMKNVDWYNMIFILVSDFSQTSYVNEILCKEKTNECVIAYCIILKMMKYE